jgi:hypothetical protein
LKEGLVVYSPNAEQIIRLKLDEILIEWHAKICYASANGYKMTVSLNTTITPELEQEGMIRDLICVIQDLRNKNDLPVDKGILVKSRYYSTKCGKMSLYRYPEIADIRESLEGHQALVSNAKA